MIVLDSAPLLSGFWVVSGIGNKGIIALSGAIRSSAETVDCWCCEKRSSY